MGAARLAMAGASGVSPQYVMTQPIIERSFEPQPDLVAAYEVTYERYTETYSALKEIP